MTEFNIRLPARSGLDGEDSFQKVENTLLKCLMENSFGAGELLQLVSHGTDLSGYYRFITVYDDFFIKIVRKEFYAQQKEADHFARYCNERGVFTSTIIRYIPNFLDDYCLLAYEWVNGRPFGTNEEELRWLGRSLGKLHNVLQQYPGALNVERLALARHKKVKNTFLGIGGEEKLRPVEKKVLKILEIKPFLFDVPLNKAQVIHGDLNAGNLRCVDQGACFLDFEDARHSFFSPALDVAFCLERSLFVRHEFDKDLYTKACAFLAEYIEESGSKPFYGDVSIENVLLWLSIRSILMLRSFENEGVAWPESEWDKFSKLISLIEENKFLFDEIEHSDYAKY